MTLGSKKKGGQQTSGAKSFQRFVQELVQKMNIQLLASTEERGERKKKRGSNGEGAATEKKYEETNTNRVGGKGGKKKRWGGAGKKKLRKKLKEKSVKTSNAAVSPKVGRNYGLGKIIIKRKRNSGRWTRKRCIPRRREWEAAAEEGEDRGKVRGKNGGNVKAGCGT